MFDLCSISGGDKGRIFQSSVCKLIKEDKLSFNNQISLIFKKFENLVKKIFKILKHLEIF